MVSGSARPVSLPSLLSFNQVVGVDVFSIYDSNGKRYEMMSVYDHGTSFHLAGRLDGHSTEAMEKSFCRIWCQTFGAPEVLAVDLETGLQAGLARFSSWHGTRLRSVAGQAHWQLGATERHNGLWKSIWKRTSDELSLDEKDIDIGVVAVNAAKNELRRHGGFSPSQAVFGKDPYVPGELLDGKDGQQQDHILHVDQQRAREHAVRMAARSNYFRCQGDQKLRRALLQRTRVTGEELNTGDFIYFHRKPRNSKEWEWRGPGTVIGKEHQNLWVSFAGRCHLVAPEHARKATGEEIGRAFVLNATRDDLQKLVEFDPDDPGQFEFDERQTEPAPELPQGEGDDVEMPKDERKDEERLQARLRRGHDGSSGNPVNKRLRKKTSDPAGEYQAMMVKRATTARGREKQLEKELPWSLIPIAQHDAFKLAENKQWIEHLEHDAVQPLSVEDSRAVLRDRPERVLPSRFAYRDKNWSKRKADDSVPWRHKARLVIGGHVDPDLHKGLVTDAPTVSRQGVLLLLQVLASRLQCGWQACAGDISAAFLNGEKLRRELYIRQPRGGIGGLHPEQIIKLTKGVFGLVDSPNAWWRKFRYTLNSMTVVLEGGRKAVFRQCALDPCIFQLCPLEGDEIYGAPVAYTGSTLTTF